jgi:hypothetical protein
VGEQEGAADTSRDSGLRIHHLFLHSVQAAAHCRCKHVHISRPDGGGSALTAAAAGAHLLRHNHDHSALHSWSAHDHTAGLPVRRTQSHPTPHRGCGCRPPAAVLLCHCQGAQASIHIAHATCSHFTQPRCSPSTPHSTLPLPSQPLVCERTACRRHLQHACAHLQHAWACSDAAAQSQCHVALACTSRCPTCNCWHKAGHSAAAAGAPPPCVCGGSVHSAPIALHTCAAAVRGMRKAEVASEALSVLCR